MKSIIIFILVLGLYSCGSDNDTQNNSGDSRVGLQALTAKCQTGNEMSPAQLDDYLWNNQEALNSVYLGQSKKVENRYSLYLRESDIKTVECKMLSTKQMTITQVSSGRVESVVKEVIKSLSDGSICNSNNKNQSYILNESRFFSDVISNVVLNNPNLKIMLNQQGDRDILCLKTLQSQPYDLNYDVAFEISKSLWNANKRILISNYSNELGREVISEELTTSLEDIKLDNSDIPNLSIIIE